MNLLNISKWFFKFLILAFIVSLFFLMDELSFAVQKAESPCFFCHADLIIETQDGVHIKIGLDCIMCHGKSDGHTFAEDNRVKPDKVFRKLDVDKFCGDCHKNELKDFQLSNHNKGVREGIKNSPTCSNCHKGHKFENKIDRNICLDCHNDSKKSSSIGKNIKEKLMLYNVHSLKELKNHK
jgi:hypothetical protein